MSRESTLYTLAVLAVVVGMALMVWSMAGGPGTLLYAGGVIGLVGVGWMTGHIARL